MTNHYLLAGIRVLALAVLLSGCGARSAIEQTEKGEGGDSCAASCEAKHPKSSGGPGYSLKAGCACRTCSDGCKQSVCSNKETPSAECLPCFQEGLSGLCSHGGGAYFQSECLDNEDCNALVACIVACPQ